LETLDHWLTRIAAWLGRRRKPLAAGFVTLLGGFAVTAFGVGPLLPDPADLPQRRVVDDLRLDGLSQQLDALAEHELELARTEVTRAGDTADSLLRRLGAVDADAAAFLRRDAGARQLLDGKPGKMVQVRTRGDGTLVDLVARYAAADGPQRQPQFTRLTVERTAGHWRSRVEIAPLAAQTRLASGTIRNTLFAATDEAGVPDSVASQLAEIFAADIDFHRELRKGDTFGVVYEVLSADGEPVGWMPSAGRVLSAEFVSGGRQYSAIWFADGSGRGSYFGLDGRSKKRSFLASPLEFSRVTSGFALRFHPLQQSWRAHRGVDYGAPTGTPVRVVGDGRVEFAGWQNGYGNVVQVQHDNDRSTLYAHLSRIDVRQGQAVEQGQLIGAVGSTGWSTGPHLHFEFRVGGRHEDPSSLARAAQPLTLDSEAKSQFVAVAQAAQAQLDLAETLRPARSRFE
jgi:murein DD-endopeptidase MepM/ murein hydrolase activator NlpD